MRERRRRYSVEEDEDGEDEQGLMVQCGVEK